MWNSKSDIQLKKEIYVGNKVMSLAMAYIHREHKNGFPEANPHYTNAKTFKIKTKTTTAKDQVKSSFFKKKKTLVHFRAIILRVLLQFFFLAEGECFFFTVYFWCQNSLGLNDSFSNLKIQHYIVLYINSM